MSESFDKVPVDNDKSRSNNIENSSLPKTNICTLWSPFDQSSVNTKVVESATIRHDLNSTAKDSSSGALSASSEHNGTSLATKPPPSKKIISINQNKTTKATLLSPIHESSVATNLKDSSTIGKGVTSTTIDSSPGVTSASSQCNEPHPHITVEVSSHVLEKIECVATKPSPVENEISIVPDQLALDDYCHPNNIDLSLPVIGEIAVIMRNDRK